MEIDGYWSSYKFEIEMDISVLNRQNNYENDIYTRFKRRFDGY